MILGEKIRKLRIEAKMTVDELANRMDSNRSYIWEIENRGRLPSDIMMQKLAEALNVSCDFLNATYKEIN